MQRKFLKTTFSTRSLIISLSLLIIVFGGCQQSNVDTKQVPDSVGVVSEGVVSEDNVTKVDKITSTNTSTDKNEQWIDATIHYMKFEGGFYGIVTDQGIKLLPMNLAKKYREDGLKIQIQGHEVKEVMTIHQWGKPFKIMNIKK